MKDIDASLREGASRMTERQHYLLKTLAMNGPCELTWPPHFSATIKACARREWVTATLHGNRRRGLYEKYRLTRKGRIVLRTQESGR